jgi:hypothetical protein
MKAAVSAFALAFSLAACPTEAAEKLSSLCAEASR